jgi:hypothetical protein
VKQNGNGEIKLFIKIYDKDEEHQEIHFIIEIFESQEECAVKAINEAIERVWKIDGYTWEDLKAELDKLGMFINIIYEKGKYKEKEIGF